MNPVPYVAMPALEPANVGRGAGHNPFPGLRPFQPGEEQLFFGRERQVDSMIEKLAQTRFLAVVGTSGSGKSSLVNCGLMPGLFRGLLASAGPTWRVVQFRPGGNALRAMAEAIAAHTGLYPAYSGHVSLADVVETHLRMSSRGLVDAIRKVRLPDRTNLLVVVDQFEELFRYCSLRRPAAPDERSPMEDATAFVNLLLEAAANASPSIYIVLTMRSDFLGDCSLFHGLPEAINGSQYLVPRLTRDERRAAIAGPVAVSGAEIDPVLLTRLVNDVGDNPDQLSILQHALNRTWARWHFHRESDRPIVLADYEAIGTMSDALDRHAEKAYCELPEGRPRQLCERMFKALTDTGTDARGIRRPARFDTLASVVGATPEELAGVIDVFRKPSRSFLMPPLKDPLTPATVIDISHESLMRVWRRLKIWTDEEAQSARIYRRLADTAVLHADGRASLWRDPELQLALDWRARREPTAAWAELYDGRFETAMSFLDRSRDVRDRARAEATFDQRWRTMWRVPVMLLAIALLVFFVEALHQPFSAALARAFSEFQRNNIPEMPFLTALVGAIARGLAGLIAFTVISMPAILTYVVLDHLGRRTYRQVAFDRILGEIAAETALPLQEATGVTEEAVEPDVVWKTSYAPAGARLQAGLVDGFVTALMFLGTIFVVAFVEAMTEIAMRGEASDELTPTGNIVAVILWLALSVLYQAIPISTASQATLGMRAARIFVVSRRGRRVTFPRAVLRHVTKPLSYGLFGVGLLMQPFTRRRQALHDILSKSVVLSKPDEAPDPVSSAAPVAAPARRRIVAFAVDWCIGAGLYFVAVIVVLAFLGFPAQISDNGTLAAIGLWLLLWSVYHAWTTSAPAQASLGMRAAGIHVADAGAGGRLSFARAAWRHLAKLPAYATGIGVLIQPFTEKKQALHDILSRSTVLCGRPSAASISVQAETKQVAPVV